MPHALLALFSVACLGAQPPEPTGDDAARAYLHDCERFGFAGSVLIAQRGEIVLSQGFGLADRERGIANTPATLFEIASATKPFTAVAILQLAQEGRLSLDDPIAGYLPGVPKSMADITIYHLLTHTSGMPRIAAGGGGDDLEKAVAGYFSTPRARKPGTQHEYWNGGYALLAGIVERASGGTYMDWCHRHIFEPAGMKVSGFTGEACFDGRPVAIGYEGDEAPRRADEHPYGSYGWGYRGMGGLVTNVEDFYRFGRALQSDVLLSKKSRDQLLEPFLDSYACGFYVIDEPRKKIGHGGDVRGFHCQFFMYPDEDAAIIVLCNVGQIPIWGILENLECSLFGGKSRCPRPPQTEAWKPDELASLAGTYVASKKERILVRVEGEGVSLLPDGIDATLALYAADFEAPEDPDPELVKRAQSIVESVAKGDPEPLRRSLNQDIPKSWADDVVNTYWPKHVGEWGELKSVHASGATAFPGVTTVLLALEHARGTAHLKIEFHGPRLQIFELHGPESLAPARAVPDAKDQLLRFAWMGAQPPPIEIVRDKKKAIKALRIPAKSGAMTFERAKE